MLKMNVSGETGNGFFYVKNFIFIYLSWVRINILFTIVSWILQENYLSVFKQYFLSNKELNIINIIIKIRNRMFLINISYLLAVLKVSVLIKNVHPLHHLIGEILEITIKKMFLTCTIRWKTVRKHRKQELYKHFP